MDFSSFLVPIEVNVDSNYYVYKVGEKWVHGYKIYL